MANSSAISNTQRIKSAVKVSHADAQLNRKTHVVFFRCARGIYGSGNTRSQPVWERPGLRHENSMSIRSMSPKQDAIWHQAMETVKINHRDGLGIGQIS
ncbi:hypothetical protein EVAR_6841_1 [Eumeta japonica]|uniref:Uncharacterized protein n=1 Tax=Eumeta variegata TaxID=151549 RepID=A0A4C1U6D8_EUMVA|nr:hypothetical protein EVAR_6841_1 [Eumeta japonica]